MSGSRQKKLRRAFRAAHGRSVEAGAEWRALKRGAHRCPACSHQARRT